MKKYMVLALALVVALAAVFAGGTYSQASAQDSPRILEFDSMVGLPAAFTGSQNMIRGIPGGGLPWEIGDTYGRLKANGRLEIIVRGLVFADGPNKGANTIPFFRATVSCLASDGSVVNVATDPFPATVGAASEGGGNAKIRARLALPQPCLAPIIFVTSPTGAWFAVTGG